MKLKDKIAIVTGGSRGIGRAICLALVKQRAKVVVNYSSQADKDFNNAAKNLLQEIDKLGGSAVGFDADVSDRSKVDEMIEFAVKKYGRIDIVVANAGICPFEKFLDIDEQLLDRVIATNLKGSFFVSQSAIAEMVKQKTGGRIIFISSVSSIFGGKLQAHYCATKGAINQLMKSIAIAHGRDGITANAVLPGTVITDINRKELEADKELLDYFIKRTPIGRLATAEDIANAVVFFASDNAAAISGATLVVDGGMSVNLQ